MRPAVARCASYGAPWLRPAEALLREGGSMVVGAFRSTRKNRLDNFWLTPSTAYRRSPSPATLPLRGGG
jgi:hypothetical protein